MSGWTVGQWSKNFTVTSAFFLVGWQVAALLGAGGTVQVYLGVYGFVLHMVFGKAYTLVPSYFDRTPGDPRAFALVLALTSSGTLLLAAGTVVPVLFPLGALLWVAGVAVFVGSVGWAVRDNLLGGETATSEANRDRRAVDRYANLFVPVALAYLVVGSYDTLAATTALPAFLVASLPRVAHLMAAGTAALLLLALGFRLLPRFLVVSPPRPLVWLVLPTGAVGPVLLATTLLSGTWFQVGAAVEATAVVGFALAYTLMWWRSERNRVGLNTVLFAAVSGVFGVLVGLHFAFAGVSASLVTAHVRLNLLGFLGLSIVGIAYQFYPPNVGRFPGGNDRTAYATVALLAGGLWLEAAGLVLGVRAVPTVGRLLALVGSLGYVYVVGRLVRQQRRGRR